MGRLSNTEKKRATARAFLSQQRGMTLLEVLIAMFIFLIGVLGALAAIPSGVSAARLVVFQDASIHLAQSKFAEFRRDRVDPAADLAGGYINGAGQLASGRPAGIQEPLNGNAGGYHDFAHASGDTYEYFDDIDQYEWTVDSTLLHPITVDTNFAPIDGGAGTPIGLTQVTVVIHLKNTTREFRFTQYMSAYDAN
jgi:prepilin-type N-terminal cleavage/methylation domain-containing protein